MKRILAMLAVVVLGYAGNVMAAPFQNGSFENNSALWNNDTTTGIDNLNASEQDLTGWTIEILSGSALEWILAGAYGSALTNGGSYKIEFAGVGATRSRISQIFDTEIGKTYQISYWLYGRAIASTAQNREILVTVKNSNSGGSTVFSRTDAPAGNETWGQYNFTFTATSSQTYLSFENKTASGHGTYLDLVNVNMLPNYTTTSHFYVDDPYQEGVKPVPGQDVAIALSLSNDAGAADAGSLKLDYQIPNNMAYRLDSCVFVDGEIVAKSQDYDPINDFYIVSPTGLSCCNGGGELSFSSQTSGTNFSYIPQQTIEENGYFYDPNVRRIRVTPSGVSNNGVNGAVGFRTYCYAKLQ